MSAAGGKSVKLLLAEDNPLVRELIVKGLEPFCEIETSADGADALLKVIDDPPDVILCDYKCRGWTDGSFSKVARARGHQAHSIPVHGQPPGYRRTAEAAGGRRRGFIPKPFFGKGLGARHEKSCRPAAPRKTAEESVTAGSHSRPAGRDEHDRPDAVTGDGAEVVPV